MIPQLISAEEIMVVIIYNVKEIIRHLKEKYVYSLKRWEVTLFKQNVGAAHK